MTLINVLITEDHALTRFALKTSLMEADFINEVFEAENAGVAYKILEKNKIDVILMDIGLPVTDGISATYHIKKKHPDTKVIILTSHVDKKEVETAVQAGISAYCSKDIEPEKLINIINDVKDGALWFDSAVSSFILSKNTGCMQSNSQNKDKYGLTLKEAKVLTLLSEGNSNFEIAKKLNISINTIKVHMCAILQKLSVDDRTQAAIKAIRENLI